MSKMTFLKNFAASTGICAGVGAVVAGGAILVSGGLAAASIPAVVGFAAMASLGTAGFLGFAQYVVAPFAEIFVGVITAFAGARQQESDLMADKGFGMGTGFSAVISAVISAAALATASLNGAFADAADKNSVAATADFHCAANENRVENTVIDSAGKRTLTITCQPK